MSFLNLNYTIALFFFSSSIAFVKSFILHNRRCSSFLIINNKKQKHDYHRPFLSTATLLSSNNNSNSNENNTNIENSKKSTIITDFDDENVEEYWNNKKIHTLGNTGTLGGLHAAMGPISTILIDKLAFNGINVRTKVSKTLYDLVTKGEKNMHKENINDNNHDIHVLDMCCGVGMSTRALQSAFYNHNGNDEKKTTTNPRTAIIHGIDTSPEMIEFARFMTKHDKDLSKVLQEKNVKNIHDVVLCEETLRTLKESYYYLNANDGDDNNKLNNDDDILSFSTMNAENTTFLNNSFDLVTIMYALHEVPIEGRYRILNEAKRLLKRNGYLAIVDISPDFHPSTSMLAGEPFVLEYLKNIHMQLMNFKEDLSLVKYDTIIPNHVRLWLLQKM